MAAMDEGAVAGPMASTSTLTMPAPAPAPALAPTSAPAPASAQSTALESQPHHQMRSKAPQPGAFAALADDTDRKHKKKEGTAPKRDPLPKRPALPSTPHFVPKILDHAPQVLRPEDEPFYATPQQSRVVRDALERSRMRWTRGGVLARFSTSSKSKHAKPIQQAPHNLAAIGKLTVVIGPHTFSDTKMWEVKWAAVVPTPAQPVPPKPKPAPVAAPPPAPTPSVPNVPKVVSPALIAQLSEMAATDPALSEILRLAASGTATQAQLQSLARYISALERQKQPSATSTSTPASPQPVPAGAPAPRPSHPAVAHGPSVSPSRSALPPPTASTTVPPRNSPSTPTTQTASASTATAAYYPGMPQPSRPPQPSTYYPGMPQPKPSTPAYYPGVAQPRPPPSPSSGSPHSPSVSVNVKTQQIQRPAPANVSAPKPIAARPAAPSRAPSLIIEFRETAGERWMVPDLFGLDHIAPPPQGQLLLSFFVQPQAGLDPRGRPKPPVPAVKCELQLQDLSQFSYDALVNLGKTVPRAKRDALFDNLTPKQATPLFLQFRLPHPPNSPAYQRALEIRRAEELKRKGVVTAGAAGPAEKKLKVPGKKKSKPPPKPKFAGASGKAPTPRVSLGTEDTPQADTPESSEPAAKEESMPPANADASTPPFVATPSETPQADLIVVPDAMEGVSPA